MKPVEFQLDPQELALLADSEVLPRKHRVQQKLEKILLQTGQTLNEMAFPLPWSSKSPKLSRGENYEQQAYRVMDFPRIQAEGGFLFYRTLILWGHPIGMHLIASGHFMERLCPSLLAHYPSLAPHWYYAAQDTPWIWQANAQGLIPCHSMEEDQLKIEIAKRKFLKLSSFVDLDQYADLQRLSQDRFAELHGKLIEPLLD
ncbi:MAG: hypothetical protein AB8H47_19985 [Bacteroidia bacterium]